MCVTHFSWGLERSCSLNIYKRSVNVLTHRHFFTIVIIPSTLSTFVCEGPLFRHSHTAFSYGTSFKLCICRAQHVMSNLALKWKMFKFKTKCKILTTNSLENMFVSVCIPWNNKKTPKWFETGKKNHLQIMTANYSTQTSGIKTELGRSSMCWHIWPAIICAGRKVLHQLQTETSKPQPSISHWDAKVWAFGLSGGQSLHLDSHSEEARG